VPARAAEERAGKSSLDGGPTTRRRRPSPGQPGWGERIGRRCGPTRPLGFGGGPRFTRAGRL